ncbi:HK97 gp10 family phage protein [Pluralibacter gergoviae]
MAKGWDFDPSQFMGIVEEDVGKRLRIISMALLSEIVYASPVGNVTLWKKGTAPKGYTGGGFRANNQVSIGSPDYSDLPDTDKTGAATIQKGNAVIAQAKPFAVIYIQNNKPYAEELERGHSTQAPTGVYANSFHGVSQAYK